MGRRIELVGATAVVTGAGAGIGRATALALGRRGARVVVTDIDGERAAVVAEEVRSAGGVAEHRQLDVTDGDAVVAAAAELDPVDVVVANAGVGMSGRLAEMAIEDWEWIRSINLDGVVRTCHAFGPPMLGRRRGHVVIVSSGLGYTPRATEPAYCTTKAAVLQLAQCLRADWRSSGVGVSAICPGVIDTGILDGTRFIGVDDAEIATTRKVFRRGHSPDTVARDVLRAIDGDRALVASGWEAKVGWGLRRLTPLGVSQLIARQGLR